MYGTTTRDALKKRYPMLFARYDIFCSKSKNFTI